MEKEQLNKPLAHYLSIVDNIIAGEVDTCLSVTKLSLVENKYFFCLRKPLIDLKFTKDYKTGIVVHFEQNGNDTFCSIKKQTPSYIPVLVIITLFLLFFNIFMLHRSNSVFNILPLLILLLVVITLNSINSDKIIRAFKALFIEKS